MRSNVKYTLVPCRWKSTVFINLNFHCLTLRYPGTMRGCFYYRRKSTVSDKYLVIGSACCQSLNLNLQLSGCQGTAGASNQMISWRWFVLLAFGTSWKQDDTGKRWTMAFFFNGSHQNCFLCMRKLQLIEVGRMCSETYSMFKEI